MPALCTLSGTALGTYYKLMLPMILYTCMVRYGKEGWPGRVEITEALWSTFRLWLFGSLGKNDT